MNDLLATIDAEAARFERYHNFHSAERARRLEQNPAGMLARAKQINARKLRAARSGSMPLHEEWRIILATKSVPEICAILRGIDPAEEQLRRTAPFDDFTAEDIRSIQERFQTSEQEYGLRQPPSDEPTPS